MACTTRTRGFSETGLGLEWGEGRGGGYRWRPGRALVRQIPSHLGFLSRPSTAAVPAGCRHLPPSTVSSCLSFRATTDSEKTFVGPTGSREVCGESLHESVRRSIRREHLVARAHHVDERAHEAVRRPEHPPAHVHHFLSPQRYLATAVSRPFLPQILPILRHFSPVLSVLAPGSRKPRKNGEKTAQNGRKVAGK